MSVATRSDYDDRPERRQSSARLTSDQETAIVAWLAQIEETDRAPTAELLTACRRDPETLAYFTGRAANC